MRTECQRKIILIHLLLCNIYFDHFLITHANFLAHQSLAPQSLDTRFLAPQRSLHYCSLPPIARLLPPTQSLVFCCPTCSLINRSHQPCFGQVCSPIACSLPPWYAVSRGRYLPEQRDLLCRYPLERNSSGRRRAANCSLVPPLYAVPRLLYEGRVCLHQILHLRPRFVRLPFPAFHQALLYRLPSSLCEHLPVSLVPECGDSLVNESPRLIQDPGVSSCLRQLRLRDGPL